MAKKTKKTTGKKRHESPKQLAAARANIKKAQAARHRGGKKRKAVEPMMAL